MDHEARITELERRQDALFEMAEANAEVLKLVQELLTEMRAVVVEQHEAQQKIDSDES